MAVSNEVQIVVSRSLGGLTYLPGQGTVLPQRIEATATSPSWSAEITVAIVIEGGQAIADEVRVRRDALAGTITSATLRSIPVASIVRHAVKTAAIPARNEDGRLSIQILGSDGSAQTVSGVADVMPRRRPRLSAIQRTQLLEEIASVYREALVADGNPRPALHVANVLGYSGSHARKLIHEARTEGFLGPAPGPGQIGEVSTDTKEPT